MKLSFTYHLTLWVIKLKGIKRNFGKNPVDVKKIRKEDMYQPKGSFFKKNVLQSFQIAESSITEVGLDRNAKNLLIFIHGGAFISGPAQHHWDTVKEITKRTNHTVWLCNYPKAPEHQIKKISENIDTIYTEALKSYNATHISIIGDSVGGTLTTALVQRLIAKKVAVPKQVILVTPVMDSSMSNPQIDAVEPNDPMLSKAGIFSAKQLCAGETDLKDPMMSPLYGSFQGFPKTVLFLAQYDIMYPDGKLAAEKIKNAHIEMEIIEGIRMPHIWPFLPVMSEAKNALSNIIQILNN